MKYLGLNLFLLVLLGNLTIPIHNTIKYSNTNINYNYSLYKNDVQFGRIFNTVNLNILPPMYKHG